MVPYKPRSRKSSYKSKAPAKSSKKSFKPKVKLSLKKYVNYQIHKNQENKLRASGGKFLLMPTTHPNYQTNCIFPLTPYYEAGLSAGQNLDISQGTGVSNRIGNSIKTRSGKLRIVMYPRGYNVTDNTLTGPMNVTMWIFKLKSGVTDSSGVVYGSLIGNWFKFNNSTNPITNTLADNVLVPNDSVYTLLKRKVFKLGTSETTSGSGGSAVNQYLMNNDYKLNQIINLDVTKYLRKQIKYQDNTLMPNTATTWICFTVARADGSTYTSTQIPAEFQIEYDYRFEDA